jgi:hypothetical protein
VVSRRATVEYAGGICKDSPATVGTLTYSKDDVPRCIYIGKQTLWYGNTGGLKAEVTRWNKTFITVKLIQ